MWILQRTCRYSRLHACQLPLDKLKDRCQQMGENLLWSSISHIWTASTWEPRTKLDTGGCFQSIEGQNSKTRNVLSGMSISTIVGDRWTLVETNIYSTCTSIKDGNACHVLPIISMRMTGGECVYRYNLHYHSNPIRVCGGWYSVSWLLPHWWMPSYSNGHQGLTCSEPYTPAACRVVSRLMLLGGQEWIVHFHVRISKVTHHPDVVAHAHSTLIICR